MNLQEQTTRTINPAVNHDTEMLRRQSTRVLIQQKGSQQYLSAGGGWSIDVVQAVSFRSGSAAVEQIVKRKLANVQLVLIRDIRVSEIIPVDPSICG